MAGDRRRAPVVVAVADADPADDAVEWAAAEAAACGTGLVVVHAVRAAPMGDVGGPAWFPGDAGAVVEAATEVLRAAGRRAGAVASDIGISGELLCGPPAGALGARSRGAGLLVLGGSAADRQHRRPGRLAGRVSARACCPVAVVRCRLRTPDGPARPRVVLGVDPARSGPDLFEFAFRSAGRRGVPLVAVHAWGGDVPADLEGVCGPAAATLERAGAELDRVLGPWRRRFPAVPVEVRLLRAAPVAALLAESRGAALVVVGSRRGAGPLGALRESVGRSLVQRSGSPTVVVRPGRDVPWRPRTAASGGPSAITGPRPHTPDGR
jgi:nucleotide-binding universal stress UspA family protein